MKNRAGGTGRVTPGTRMHWDELGCAGMQARCAWDALGCTGMCWDAGGWDAGRMPVGCCTAAGVTSTVSSLLEGSSWDCGRLFLKISVV